MSRRVSTNVRSLWATMAIAVVFAVVGNPRAVSAADGIDLARLYPATLDYSPAFTGYEWTCDAKDVWRLTNFAYGVGDRLRVEVKSAQVVLAHHDSTVLWAAVFPDQPGDLVKAEAGQGAHITSIWLRFHPARLGEIFPAQTVKGRGDPAIIRDARRLAAHKIKGCWHNNALPAVPEKASITVDLETREGPRRFFSIDTASSTVLYAPGFGRLPGTKVVETAKALEAFDRVWNAFDREYAMFVIKPGVDWQKLRDEYRPRVSQAKDNWQLAELIAEMLAHLKDLHVFVRVDGFDVPVYERGRPLNANRAALAKFLGDVAVHQHDLTWRITSDDIGYIAIDRLTDPQLPQTFVETLDKMEQTSGLILDLRYNGGGNETLGQQIAGAFLDHATIYARSQYRNGPKHTDLGIPESRICGPTDPWHYVGPVVVLQGQRTMSSAESLVMMLSRCPQVTTMGDRTAGSSGNPRVLQAGTGITVNLPRWNDLDAESKPIDAIGVRPKVVVTTTAADFSGNADPVLSAALERLRANKAPEGKSLTLRPGARRPNDRPHVLEVSPRRGATAVEPNSELRVRFDRPMDPESYALNWMSNRGEYSIKEGFRLRGPVRYDAQTHEFIFPMILSPGTAHHIEVAADRAGFPQSQQRFFRSPDGMPAAAFDWQFQTRPAPPQAHPSRPNVADTVSKSAYVAEAGRSQKLAAIVGSVRRRRRALKSVVERVDERSEWTDQQRFFRMLRPPGWAQFWWQDKSRFRADGCGNFFNGTPLQVGDDGHNCWSRIGDRSVIAPSERVAQKNVLICDPLRSASSATDAALIKELQLEYAGDEQHNGTVCHRLRSWASEALEHAGLREFEYCEWLFDAKTLLPVLFETFGERPVRREYSYESIDKDLPAAVFQPPREKGLDPRDPDALGDGYDRHFVNALDGSAGRISIRWGKRGVRGVVSSGLN